jgi:periplasmic protein TonB
MRRAATPSLRPLAAVVSAGTTAAIFAALVAAGIIRAEPRHDPKPMTVISLAAVSGSENAEAEAAPAITEPTPTELQPAAAPPAEAPPPPLAPVPTQPAKAVSAVPVPMPAAAPASARATAPAAATSAPAPASATATAAPTTAAPARRGVRDGLNANAPSGTSRAYAARVRSWLLSHKIYPKYARMRRLEGVVRVRFVLDRAGRLIEGGLLGGSGEKTLDAEGEAMLRRASPYPAAPSAVTGERIAFTAAIAFELTD